MKPPQVSINRQAGATLLVGMIMLILMTLLALGAIRLANTNLKVVANEQLQREGEAAADYAIAQIANSPTFTQATGAQAINVDAGAATYTVTVAKPDCKRFRTIPNTELVTVSGGKPTIAAKDIPCIGGASSSGLTIADATATASKGGESLCAATAWELQATAVPVAGGTQTGVSVVVTEGIEQRIAVAEAQNACK